MEAGDWTVIVPIKALASAKRRLRGAVAERRHENLVLAMAQDTIAAADATPGVRSILVVTADPIVASALCAMCIPEPARGGLNAAIAHAAAVAGGPRLAVIPADLPALRPADLAAALRAAAAQPGTIGAAAAQPGPIGAAAAQPGPIGAATQPDTVSYVPDAAGTGTVLLAAAGADPLVPRFGQDSARAHERAGARRLRGWWPTLRRDVDTAADLTAAVALGVGRHTAACLSVALM